jgi:hypothetical protein
MAQFFYPCLKSCTGVEQWHLWAADDSVRILGKRESKDPEFQKEYLNLVGEGPASVTPDEIEKLVRELPRYRNRRAFQKNQRDECNDCKT